MAMRDKKERGQKKQLITTMAVKFSALFFLFGKNKYRNDYCYNQLFLQSINIDICYALLKKIYSESFIYKI
jgi:hypothetical protein